MKRCRAVKKPKSLRLTNVAKRYLGLLHEMEQRCAVKDLTRTEEIDFVGRLDRIWVTLKEDEQGTLSRLLSRVDEMARNVVTLRGALLHLIERRKLDICPVLARNGRVDFWVVGVRTVNPRSGQNTVTDRVKGTSLEIALAAFLSSEKR